MKKRRIADLLMLFFLVWIPLPLSAASTPDMFAYGMKIETSGKNAFYELELPLDVYMAVTNKDLDDIRVFNAEGAVVPHVLARPETQTKQKKSIILDLPFFPLRSLDDESDGTVSIHVETDEKGAIVDVRTENTDGAGQRDPKIVSYLIDCRELKDRPLNALELEWDKDPSDFMGIIYVEESRDLNIWRRIGNETIARLSYGKYQLVRKRISLTVTDKSYLRLRWPEGQKNLEISGIKAISNNTYTQSDTDYRWTKATLAPVLGKEGHYAIDLGGFLPADKVNIRLKDTNTLAGIKLYSGPSPEKNNATGHWQGLAYNLEYQNTTLHNSVINIMGKGARYWLLVLDKSETMPGIPPDVVFGWQPHRLIFLASGNGPFQLAYGSINVPPPDFSVDPLLRKYSQGSEEIMSGQAALGGQFILAGPDRLIPDPPPVPWKKYILWSTLLAGALVIVVMSVTLFRQLQAADKQNGL